MSKVKLEFLGPEGYGLFLQAIILALKVRFNYTQKKIASEIGISPSYFSELKNSLLQDDNTYEHREMMILDKVVGKYEETIDMPTLIEEVNARIEIERKKEIEKGYWLQLKMITYTANEDKILDFATFVDEGQGLMALETEDKVRYLNNDLTFFEIDREIRLQHRFRSKYFQLYISEYFEDVNFEELLIGFLGIYEEGHFTVTPFILTTLEEHNSVDLDREMLKPYFQYDIIRKDFAKERSKSLQKLCETILEFNKYNQKVEMRLPKELSTAYKQFLGYFADYVHHAKGIQIQFDVLTVQDSLEFQINTFGETTMDKVGEYLSEYLGFAGQNLEKLKVPVAVELSDRDFNLLVMDLKNQVTSLKHSLEIAQIRNGALLEQSNYLKQLTTEFAKKDIAIHVQNISGGDQQFADEIKNQKP